jgi:hypothetical protein
MKEDTFTLEGAERLLEKIKANCPFEGVKFWIEKTEFGVYAVRSDMFRGLPRKNGKETNDKPNGKRHSAS